MNPSLISQRIETTLPLLIDRHVGVIRNVEEVRRVPGSPDFFHYAARASNTAAFTQQTNFNVTGGASKDRHRAIYKAVGEAVERYCGAIYDVQQLPLTSYADAPFPCVRPSDFALYSPEQFEEDGFPWAPFNDDTTIRWTPAQDVLTGELRYIPATMAYVPYVYYIGTGDTPIAQNISTGLAAHESYERAALGAVNEVIERDAFTIHWQAKIAPPQILMETLDDESYELVQRFDHAGCEVVLFDLTMDHGVPTILSVLRSKHQDNPALVFAASSSINPIEAMRSALEELAHTRRYSQQIKARMEPLAIEPGFPNVTNQMEHLNLYADHSNGDLASFIFTSKRRTSFSDIANESTGDPKRDLELTVKKIEAVGHRTYVADLTSSDIAEVGLRVVRAVVPGFHPLFMGYRLRALGGERLWTIPQKLGYPGVTRETGDNPAPHPYP